MFEMFYYFGSLFIVWNLSRFVTKKELEATYKRESELNKKEGV